MATPIQGTAISSDGRQSVDTVKMVNSISGDKALIIQFNNTNAGGGAAQAPYIKYGCHQWNISATGGASEAVVTNFDDYKQLQEYFKSIATGVFGLKAYTNDTSNFLKNLIFREKQPDGTTKTVLKSMSKYMQPLGGGTYGNEIEIPESDLQIGVWPGLEIQLESLKANTSITFTLYVKGWNKVAELSALEAGQL